MNEQERARAFAKGLDLAMLISALDRAKSLADEIGEYPVAEEIDVLLGDLEARRSALKDIIVG